MAENSEQGNVNEPEEIAAEDAVGAQETPTERQLDREQAIVDEPVAESEQRIGEATSMAGPASGAPAEDEEEDLEYVEETPREKPAIPGMDLEVDIVREGEEALAARSRYSEELDYEDVAEEEEEEPLAETDDELPQTIADAAIDLAADA